MWETSAVVGRRFPSPVRRRGFIAAFHRTAASIARSLVQAAASLEELWRSSMERQKDPGLATLPSRPSKGHSYCGPCRGTRAGVTRTVQQAICAEAVSKRKAVISGRVLGIIVIDGLGNDQAARR